MCANKLYLLESFDCVFEKENLLHYLYTVKKVEIHKMNYMST